MCSELVSTDKFKPARCGHICRVVEPPSIITPSPGWHSSAARFANRVFRRAIQADIFVKRNARQMERRDERGRAGHWQRPWPRRAPVPACPRLPAAPDRDVWSQASRQSPSNSRNETKPRAAIRPRMKSSRSLACMLHQIIEVGCIFDQIRSCKFDQSAAIPKPRRSALSLVASNQSPSLLLRSFDMPSKP